MFELSFLFIISRQGNSVFSNSDVEKRKSNHLK